MVVSRLCDGPSGDDADIDNAGLPEDYVLGEPGEQTYVGLLFREACLTVLEARRNLGRQRKPGFDLEAWCWGDGPLEHGVRKSRVLTLPLI